MATWRNLAIGTVRIAGTSGIAAGPRHNARTRAGRSASSHSHETGYATPRGLADVALAGQYRTDRAVLVLGCRTEAYLPGIWGSAVAPSQFGTDSAIAQARRDCARGGAHGALGRRRAFAALTSPPMPVPPYDMIDSP